MIRASSYRIIPLLLFFWNCLSTLFRIVWFSTPFPASQIARFIKVVVLPMFASPYKIMLILSFKFVWCLFVGLLIKS